MKSKSTPDERFLIKLYETALAGGDPHALIDYRGVAKALVTKRPWLKISLSTWLRLTSSKKGMILWFASRSMDVILF